MNGISVLLCGYNSAARLPQTLHHLAAQTLPDGLQGEVILVNNGSTDNTVEVAHKEWVKYPSTRLSFRVVHEGQPGLSFARQTGIREARYDYLLFCDDDNWLFPDYLGTAIQFSKRIHQSVA